MTTLRLCTDIGKNVRICVFQQLTRQQKVTCAPDLWNGRRSYGVSGVINSHIIRTLPLLRIQPHTVPSFLNHRQRISNKSYPDHAGKTETKSSAAIANEEIFGESSKLGLFAKFKLMYKKYWYILIPVHIVTSIGWFGGFYYLSQSGVDIASLLHELHVSDRIIEKMQNSSMGHLAIAYLCYKIATPLRYMLTLGGTTVSIKYLVQAGYIKPIPTKQEFMNMYEKKKADLTAAKDKEK